MSAVDVDAGGHAEVVEQGDQLLGGQVPGGARRERRAAQPADRRVEAGDAELQGGVGGHERRAPGLVQVQPDVGADRVDDLGDAAGRGHAGGVGAGDGRAAAVAQPLPPARPPRRVAISPSYGEPKLQLSTASTGTSPATAQIAGDRLGRLVDRHADVALAVGLRQRRGDGELVDLALEGQLGATDVGDERRVPHALATEAPAASTSAAPAMAGTAFGDTNATASMRVTPAADQRLDEPHPVLDRDRGLRLQAVPRPDVTDDDGVGQRRQVHRTSVPPRRPPTANQARRVRPGGRRGGGR